MRTPIVLALRAGRSAAAAVIRHYEVVVLSSLQRADSPFSPARHARSRRRGRRRKFVRRPRTGEQADDAQAAATLTVRSSRYGRILFDGRGRARALYAFTRDRRGGRSRRYGACAKAWPVYFAKGRALAGKGVRQSLIGTTRRRDGRRQITYNGRPLYYYVGDKSPGQVLCQNVDEFGGTWLVVRPNGRLVR